MFIAGVQRGTDRTDTTKGVLLESMVIVLSDKLDTPNRCEFETFGFAPSPGDRVIVTLGGADNPDRLFYGRVMTVDHGYVGTPGNIRCGVMALDDTYAMGMLRVTMRYTSASVSTIVADLMDTYAPDFTYTRLEAGLETVDEITFTNEGLVECLERLKKRIGATAYLDPHNDLHFFVTAETGIPLPDDLLATTTDLQDFKVARDISQMITRVNVEGGGAPVLACVEAGDTIIPVADATWYPPVGKVICGPQIIDYTGVDEGGGGGLVGEGASPSALLTLTGEFGTALDNTADYDYAYTFVTGAGESLPSPLTEFTTGSAVSPPTLSMGRVAVNTGPPNNFGSGGTVYYATSWEYPGTLRTTVGGIAGLVVGASTEYVQLSSIPQPTDSEATGINIWRSPVNGYTGIPSLQLVDTVAVGVTTYEDDTTDAALGANAHTVATAVCREVRITNIPAGQNGVVTQRKLYRTEGGGAQLKLLTTLADNTTATFEDDVADGSLGANAPLSDTSGLAQEDGIVAAGSTSIPVAGGSFPNAGWAIAASQVIRYTGRTASALTGVPATGIGSLQAPLGYNTTIKATSQLTGIAASGDGSIVFDLIIGDDVNLYVTADDLAAQAVLAALVGGDGIREEFMQDQRIGYEEAVARAEAFLDLRAEVQISLSWRSKDRETRPGRPIHVYQPQPLNIEDDFKIRTVTITNFVPAGPYFDATASNTLYTFEELLRQARSTRRAA